MIKPIIEIKDMSVIYDENTPAETVASKDVNLDIYEKEYVIEIGYIDTSKLNAEFNVNNETFKINEGEVYTLSDGLHLIINYITADFEYEGKKRKIVEFTLWKDRDE